MIFKRLLKQRYFFSLALFLSCLVFACRSSPIDQSSDASNSTSITDDCRRIEHVAGETEVCGQPQRVVALSPYTLDSTLALGVQPVGIAESESSETQLYDNPEKQIPYIGKQITTEPIALGMVRSPSLERLTSLQPDLILGENIAHEESYSLLSRIAPTLLFSERNTPEDVQSWQNDIEGIALALGREDRAEELLFAHKAQISQARAALQPVLHSYPRVLLLASNLNLTDLESQPESTVGRLLQEIGFEIVRPEGFLDARGVISWEVVPQIETDLILVMSWSDDLTLNPEEIMPGETMRDAWRKHPLLSTMPAFQQNRVFFVDYYLWSGVSRGPLSDQLVLEALPDLLLSTVEETS